VRVYDHFGLQWRLPLYDAELMDFWARVPVHWRYARKLYFRYVAKHQDVPVRAPNTDRSALAAWAVTGASRLGLASLGKEARRRWRRLNWRREWQDCSSATTAWLAAVDRGYFGRTFSGRETLHSYMTVRYLADAIPSAVLNAILERNGYERLLPTPWSR
jgi:hypothetical protein